MTSWDQGGAGEADDGEGALGCLGQFCATLSWFVLLSTRPPNRFPDTLATVGALALLLLASTTIFLFLRSVFQFRASGHGSWVQSHVAPALSATVIVAWPAIMALEHFFFMIERHLTPGK